EIADIRLRVFLVEDVDALDVILGCHRACDTDRHRHRVAVLDQRRDIELYLAGLDRLAADDIADRGPNRRGGLFRGPHGHGEDRPTAGKGKEFASRGVFHLVSYSRSVTRYATMSSICSAVRIGLPCHVRPTRFSPSMR